MNARRHLVSIIVCTRDRAESLRHTLRAIDDCIVPADLSAELLVVDNGSQDRTRSVVRQAKCWGRAPRYIYEPGQGVSSARNAGLAEAQGDVLLWTDDDVRPCGDWIEAMCRPLLENRIDALAGRIALAGHLERPWLRAWHRVCLAVDAPTSDDFNLTGGNMSFARRVLKKVPAFDAELGPGAIGFCDDTLFSLQLRAAGFRLAFADEHSLATHHCKQERLTRRGLADVLARQGRSQAYVDHHWRHAHKPFASLRGGKFDVALAGLHGLHWLRGEREAIIGRREARWIWRRGYYRQLQIERGRAQQYEPRGLAKLVVSLPMADGYRAPAAARSSRRAA